MKSSYDPNSLFVQRSLFEGGGAPCPALSEVEAGPHVFGSTVSDVYKALLKSDAFGEACLINIRGLSGSGKSSVVREVRPELEARSIPVLENPSHTQIERALGSSRRVCTISLPGLPLSIRSVAQISVDHHGMIDAGIAEKFLPASALRKPVMVLGMGAVSLAAEVRNMANNTDYVDRVGKAWAMSLRYLLQNFEHAFEPDDYMNPRKLLRTTKTLLGATWFKDSSAENEFDGNFLRTYHSILNKGGIIEASGSSILRDLQQADPGQLSDRYADFLSTHTAEPFICISAYSADPQLLGRCARRFVQDVSQALPGKLLRKSLFDCKVKGKVVPAGWAREVELGNEELSNAHRAACPTHDTYMRLMVNHHFLTSGIIGAAFAFERLLRNDGLSYVVSMSDLVGSNPNHYYYNGDVGRERSIDLESDPFRYIIPGQESMAF